MYQMLMLKINLEGSMHISVTIGGGGLKPFHLFGKEG